MDLTEIEMINLVRATKNQRDKDRKTVTAWKDLDIILAPDAAVRLVLAMQTAIEAIKELRLDEVGADVEVLKGLQKSLYNAIIKPDTGRREDNEQIQR